MEYCYHCMAQITDTNQLYCPKCGKEYNVHISENYELPAGVFLGDGRYLVGKSIGTGGFGITYVGRDMKLEKKVVIKETFYSGLFERDCTDPTVENPLRVIYDPDMVSLEEIVYKTQSECLSLSKGEKFTNIVKVYDYLFENNTAYIITEHINGKTLHDRVCAIGKYTWYDLYAKMKPLMQCLASLHREGLLHRDIKPQNIMIRRAHEYSEEFVLIDFGLARTTQSSALVESAFTPGFSPPEQKISTETDGTYTDVYALAALSPGSLICMLQKLLSYPAVPVFGKNSKVIEFALVIILHQQRVISAKDTILFVNKHQAVFVIYLPIKPVFSGRESSKSRCIFHSKAELVSYCLKALFNDLNALRNIVTVYLSYHDLLPP